MYEQFDANKQKGDRLTHGEMNDLFRLGNSWAAARPSTGVHAQFYGTAEPEEWCQYAVQVSDYVTEGELTLPGRYKVKFLYHDVTDGWKVSDKEWDLDATGLHLSFTVGDRLTAWWDSQRGMFIPAAGCKKSSVDANDSATLSTIVATTNDGGSDIEFALEIGGGTSWGKIGGRSCVVNGNVDLRQDLSGNVHAAGTMHYTFLVTGETWVRVRAETDISLIDGQEVEVGVFGAALRLESVSRGGSANTVSAELSFQGTTIPGWTSQSEVNNDATRMWVYDLPCFTAGGNSIKITPPSYAGVYESWTIHAELSVVFSIRPAGSSSQSSTSSSSSSSSSSSQSSSSSSSSSSSQSSSSSSSSSSSQSSSSSVSSQSSLSSSGCKTPESKGLGSITGYDASKKQALIHDHGCLEWMDIEVC